jgi:ABC-type multidrug transport system permease subunit
MMILMNCLLGTALPTLMMFPQERPVMIREYSTNHYGIFAYFFSRLFMEALLSGIQMLVLCVLSYFMIGFQTRFGWYILIVYCLAMASSALSNLVGSAVKDPSHAIEFLPLAFLPQVLFSGFFVRPDLIPIWLRWLQYCFPLTYALKLAVYYEYRVCNPGQQQCNLLLEGFNVTADRVWFYWLMLAVLFVVLRTVALVTLTIRARKE